MGPYVYNCLYYTPLTFRMNKTAFARKGVTKPRADIKVEEAAELERSRALRQQKEFAAFGTVPKLSPGALAPRETWWSQQYQWLKDEGYLLRPRYAPDWVPSWEGSKRDPLVCEDGQAIRVSQQVQLHF